MFLEDGVIYRATPGGVREIMAQRDILLPGLHNVENYMAALAALEGLVSDETARQVARTFRGVEHRIELVRRRTASGSTMTPSPPAPAVPLPGSGASSRR